MTRGEVRAAFTHAAGYPVVVEYPDARREPGLILVPRVGRALVIVCDTRQELTESLDAQQGVLLRPCDDDESEERLTVFAAVARAGYGVLL